MNSMIEQQVKKATGNKGKEADVHVIDIAPVRPRGVTSAYIAPNAWPYQQQVQPTQAPYQAFNQRVKPNSPQYPKAEPWKLTPLPMPMAKLYAYLLEKKLVTLIFMKPRDGPPLPGFNPSKKCEHHFGVEGHTLEECAHLRHRIQDLIYNKLVQFDNTAKPNVITNPLPPYQEGNVNAISIMEERNLDFSSLSFPWKAMLWALAQEIHIVLENIEALGFDWGVCSFYNSGDQHALFDCRVL